MNNESKQDPNKQPEQPRFTVPHQTVTLTDALAQGPKTEEKTGTVRTFQSDIAGTVQTDNVSMIKMAMAEKARQEQILTGFSIR